MGNSFVNPLASALLDEAWAQAAVISIAEQLRTMNEERRRPTEEEVCLHTHLHCEWQRKAEIVTGIPNKTLR